MTRPFLATAALAVALSACSSGPSPELVAQLEALAPDPDAIRVETALLRSSDARLTLELPGEVEGGQDALLASALGGLAESVRVAEGDQVRKGDALVLIDREIYAAQVDQAEAQLEQAKGDLARLERLGDLGTAAEIARFTTQVKVAESQLRIARSQLDRAVIRAPFDGTVGALNISKGEMANPGAPIVRLVQLDPVRVTLSVSDRDVVSLRPGAPARVWTQAVSGARQGTIAHISPVGDLSTRAFKVEVEVPNPNHDLLPGMIAKAEVDSAISADHVVLPQDWIVTKLDAYGVFAVEGDTAVWREVKLGEIVRGQVVVTEGIAAGDRIVMTGQHTLVDGDTLVVAREGWCCEGGRAVFDPSTAQAH